MKRYTYLYLLFFLVFTACEDGYIDDINAVPPKPDEAAPTVQLDYPVEGTQVRVVEDVTLITISFKASDDKELQTVEVQLDGEQIATYQEFVDYRNLIVDDLVYEGLTNGEHSVTVTVTDLEGKTTSKTVTFEKVAPYDPMEDEVLYMPFDGNFVNLVTLIPATEVGDPAITTEETVAGIGAYKGVEGAYLTYPAEKLTNIEFSASFWLKLNAVPDRAGILVINPEDPAGGQNRNSGFRFFRENAGGDQRFKLSLGTGTSEVYFDGGDNADIPPSGFGEWHHFAFTISSSEVSVYIDGEVVSTGSFEGISWEGCDLVSIMSGAPRYVEFNHFSDISLMDELRIFDKALTQAEVQAIREAEMP